MPDPACGSLAVAAGQTQPHSPGKILQGHLALLSTSRDKTPHADPPRPLAPGSVGAPHGFPAHAVATLCPLAPSAHLCPGRQPGLGPLLGRDGVHTRLQAPLCFGVSSTRHSDLRRRSLGPRCPAPHRTPCLSLFTASLCEFCFCARRLVSVRLCVCVSVRLCVPWLDRDHQKGTEGRPNS